MPALHNHSGNCVFWMTPCSRECDTSRSIRRSSSARDPSALFQRRRLILPTTTKAATQRAGRPVDPARVGYQSCTHRIRGCELRSVGNDPCIVASLAPGWNVADWVLASRPTWAIPTLRHLPTDELPAVEFQIVDAYPYSASICFSQRVLAAEWPLPSTGSERRLALIHRIIGNPPEKYPRLEIQLRDGRPPSRPRCAGQAVLSHSRSWRKRPPAPLTRRVARNALGPSRSTERYVTCRPESA